MRSLSIVQVVGEGDPLLQQVIQIRPLQLCASALLWFACAASGVTAVEAQSEAAAIAETQDETEVRWSSAERAGFAVRASYGKSKISECLAGGQRVRYRFMTRVCWRRFGWGDGCSTARVETRHGELDPVTELYRITTDVYHDDDPPAVQTLDSAQKALERLSSISELRLLDLVRGQNLELTPRRTYLGVRIVAECRGGSASFLAQLPSLLTLGLFGEPGVYDTGWESFSVEPSQ